MLFGLKFGMCELKISIESSILCYAQRFYTSLLFSLGIKAQYFSFSFDVVKDNIFFPLLV